MTEAVRLDPAEVADSVRALLSKETERVDDPYLIPEDRDGWHALNPTVPSAAGAPYYDPQSWRWFELIDVGYVDEMVLVVFRWTDPTTPELRYSYLAHADALPTPDAAAAVVRGQLRRLLEAGWRDQVLKRWLSQHQVLIWRDPGGDKPLEIRERRSRSQQEAHDAAWSAHRQVAES